MFIHFKHIVCILLSGAMLLGLPCCTCKSVQDARQTISMADSMRVNEHRLYDDSLALAEAYTTFGRWRLVYPNDYARACYYYGRLLRSHGNQVDAMRAFIAGTHAPYVQRLIPLWHFHDYHILARIYSNIGTMCHLAGEFELSYEMYKNASEQILKTNDSTSYYYLLNDMAYELAEQNLHDETFSLLSRIETECTDAYVLTKTWETKAILYKNLAQYDSAIYSAKQLYSKGYCAPTGYVIEAQSFWHLQQCDSALYYAQIVMDHPNASDQDRYHMLYILMKHDPSASIEEVQTRSSERADLDAEFIEPLLQQLSVATELLRQSLEKKSSLVNLAWLMAAICLIGGCTWSASVWIKKQHTQLRRTTFLEQEKLRQQHQNSDRERRIREIEQQCNRLAAAKNLKRALHMSDYNAMKRMVNVEFNQLIDKLESINTLSQREIQFCVLVLLNVPQKQIAQIMVYSDNSIKKTKTNIAKKMKITSPNLRNYLIDIILQ